LALKGSNYAGLLERHRIHTKNVEHVVDSLRSEKIEVRLVKRREYNEETVRWADAVISAGGDGTMLLAASKVFDKSKPVIGVNTDPERSEGHLCLPVRYTHSFPEALQKLYRGEFRWQWRQRIRLYLEGTGINPAPVDLHEQQLSQEQHSRAHINERFQDQRSDVSGPHLLPVRALNEVFIGESLSSSLAILSSAFPVCYFLGCVLPSHILSCLGHCDCCWKQYKCSLSALSSIWTAASDWKEELVSNRYIYCCLLIKYNFIKILKGLEDFNNDIMQMDLIFKAQAVCSVLFRENFKSCKPSFKFSLHRASYYEISVDDGPWEKQKSSGLNVCTGTGSKAWSYNINKVANQAVEEILNIAKKHGSFNMPLNTELVQKVTNDYNDSLLYSPEEPKMFFSIREPIVNRVFSSSRQRGFSSK
ncbi:hypothetical protein ASZ78_013092, partial [Callipepla squamata]